LPKQTDFVILLSVLSYFFPMNNRSVVILAAGKGTRLEPLTKTVPKPLIHVAGHPILYHNMKSLSPYVNEYILVVGFMSELIQDEFGDTFEGKPIHYVQQNQQLGTGHALGICEESIHNDQFFMIYGDDIYDPAIYEQVAGHERAIAGKIVEEWKPFGILQTRADGMLEKIVEKPREYVGNTVNIGVFLFDKRIFNYFADAPLSLRGEYELTDIVTRYCKDQLMEVIPTLGYWFTIGYPWHILLANEALMEKVQPEILGEVEPNVVIKGNVRIGKGTVVRSGTYIDGNILIGENCTIGPNCYIRGTVVLGNDCKIGNAVEIENSSIGNKVNIEHLSFVGYSVLGNNIILGGGTITADRRHDREPIRVNIKESLVETGMHHLGAIIGDHVRTGVNTSIYPGRKLHYHSYTVPGEVVREDKLSAQDIELK
jgi:UDP-N-acetylglucosamine diphosphorylase / glucose-1-phosphate thymidylyltransferase / UDP-N-acetylgalactosamine diphosphorylase / glucosamine-1-phosphate N-acetyltransferase / galactosamine-1-phosphate N-acetyltransferase